MALHDSKDREGNQIIEVVFVAKDSPLHDIYDKNENDYDTFGVIKGNIITSIKFVSKNSALPIYGAEHMINDLNTESIFR